MNIISDFFPESDDLDAIISAPKRDEAAMAKIRAAEEQKIGYVEKCPKCRGTGQFYGRSGRAFGTCFACKGKGSKTFKQSAEKRASTRTSTAARKVKKLAESIENFQKTYPAIWAWMNSNTTFEFAINMRDALAKYGSLTERQLAACVKCVDRSAVRAIERQTAHEARVAAAPAVDTSKLEEAFQTALGNGLSYPRLRFAGIDVSPAGANSKNPGALYVKADGVYVGKIMSGKFLSVRECTDEIRDRVVTAINDPEAAAIAYGRETGSCSCCGRELTNPESIARGIGPICASTYGWGG